MNFEKLKWRLLIAMILTIFYILFSTRVSAQSHDSEMISKILAKADSSISGLNTISYWCDFRMKYLSIEDTTLRKGICYMQRDDDDSLKIKLHLIDITEGYFQVYKNGELLEGRMKDSTNLIVDCKTYGYEYVNNKFSYQFVRDNFFVENYYSIMLLDTMLESTTLDKVLIGPDTLYAITFIYLSDGEVSNKITTRYFRIDDYFPVGFVSDLDLFGMHQYKYNFISNVALNPSFDDNVFDFEYNIIDSSKMIYYLPPEEIEMLPLGSLAPNFGGLSSKGDSIELHKTESDIIILDFWFRACWPCIKSGEVLNEIVGTYPTDKVKIIGINPSDTDAKINEWVDNGKVKYDSLFDQNKKIAKAYNISGWPTIYILNSRYEIIHAMRGYHGENMYNIINEIIINHSAK